MTAPVDQAARDRIRDDHGRTLFVEAGAGTGKTTALVARLVALLRDGDVAAHEVAAITFTEAAAAELRDRVRTELEVARAAAPASTPARDVLDRALGHLDEAHISTVHAFAQAVLAEHAIAAGLPPAFEVIDEFEAGIEFDDAWRAFHAELLDEPELEHVLTVAYVLGLKRSHLHDVAHALHEHHDRMRDWAPAAPEAPEVVRGRLGERFAAVIGALEAVVASRARCTRDDDKLAAHLATVLQPFLDRLRLVEATDDLAVLEALAEAPKLSYSRGGQDAAWPGGMKKEVQGRCRAIDAEIGTALKAVRRWVLDTLAPRVRVFVLDQVDRRRREGRLAFHDLLVWARDLLRDNPSARALASARYRLVLVDEFQDTDPLQAELVVLLTAGDAEPTRSWTEAVVESGRLFFVGDPKQSIYRFRHADLFVYRAARDAHSEVELELSENFRSVPGIIEWVNAVFNTLMAADGGEHAPFRPLHPARAALGGDAPAVAAFGSEHRLSAAGMRLREAADVAALCTTVRAESWTVSDGDGTRPVRYADIAILLPTRALLPALEDALEDAGVPARVESRSLVYATPEIRDLITILSAIDDPTDAIAVVGALRTPFFGVSDAELLEYSQAGGRFDPGREPPDGFGADHRIARALAQLRRWHDGRWWKTVNQTLADVVRDLRVFAVLAVHHRPRDRWRRVRFIQEQARAFVDADAGDLRAFIEWAVRQRDEGAQSVEDALPDPDDDAVRILTVHGSKGLEFPVVVLAGANVDPANRAAAVLWTDAGPEIRFGRAGQGEVKEYFETDGYEAARGAAQDADAAERMRLLYVAATRARDHLLVSLHRQARQKNNGATVLARSLTAIDTPRIEPAPAPAAVPEPDAGAVARAAALVATRHEWAAARQDAIASHRRDRVATPTDVAARLAEAAHHAEMTERHEPAEGPPWRRGRAGTALGRAVHAVLQDARPGAVLTPLARGAAAAEGLPELADEVEARAAAALEARVVLDAFAMPTVRREVPISAPVDGVLVEGVIDLLAVDDERLVIIDYKTDGVGRDDALEAATARYAPQLASYACAVEAVLGRAVTDAYLVFAAPAGARTARIPDLAHEIARVRAVLGTE